MKSRIYDILIGAMILSIVIILLNPELVEVLSDKASEGILKVLRTMDSLVIDYELMRGNFHDIHTGEQKGKSVSDTEESSDI